MSTRQTPTPPASTPESPPATGERATADLSNTSPDGEKLLPAEREQTPGSQSPAAGQDQTDEARKAYHDAVKGRPDTSSPPQLQQSPNADRN